MQHDSDVYFCKSRITCHSGVFSTGAMGALAPVILGQSINVSTRNSKVLNTPLHANVNYLIDFAST